MKKLNVSLLGIALVLVGCGGSGSSSNDSDSEKQTSTQIGVFLDSPISNIGYKTKSFEGTTNLLGEYKYAEGETVTFFIGNLKFPAVTAGATVTPLDIVGTKDTSDSTVVNIIRLLQTLDTDGDPSNGITISDAAIANATQVDFGLSKGDFEASSAVIDLVSDSGQDTPMTGLISTADAISHFETELAKNSVKYGSIVGSWVFEGADFVVLTILDDGRFIWSETNGEEPNGMEAGDYLYNENAGTLSFSASIIDNNGDGGIDGIIAGTVEVIGNSLSFSLAEDGIVKATRVNSVSDTLVGSWLFKGNEFVVLTILNDGRFIWSETDGAEPNGMEVGDYTYNENAETISFSANVLDNNGDGGIDGISVDSVNIDSGELSFNLAEDGNVSFTAIVK